MKEYIERGELLKELERFPHLKTAGSVVRSMPKEDVVEVVRCIDCVYWDGRGWDGRCEAPMNGLVREYTNYDSFCSYGERKEKNNE